MKRCFFNKYATLNSDQLAVSTIYNGNKLIEMVRVSSCQDRSRSQFFPLKLQASDSRFFTPLWPAVSSHSWIAINESVCRIWHSSSKICWQKSKVEKVSACSGQSDTACTCNRWIGGQGGMHCLSWYYTNVDFVLQFYWATFACSGASPHVWRWNRRPRGYCM